MATLPSKMKNSDNPFIIQVGNWRKNGMSIAEEMESYEWEYRKKICSKCSLQKQRELDCFRVNNFCNGIQETHCDKLDNARTKKFSKKIDLFFTQYPLGQQL